MERRTFLLGAAASAVVVAAGCSDDPDRSNAAPAGSATSQGASDPADRANVIVIYMDDMRHDGLDFMPKTRDLFDHRFTQARANGGACTDTRLGLFSGTYLLNHPWPWEQTAEQHDASATWGPWMHGAGYRTGLFGKYITTHNWTEGIADGWDTWRTYYYRAHHDLRFKIDDGSVPVDPISPKGHNLDYLMNELIEFSTEGDRPFFASWNPQHPHTVTTTGALYPRAEHRDLWTDLPSPVPVDEDITGKPAWIQQLDPVSAEDERDIMRAQREQAQVLTGVDDAIAGLFEALEEAGIRDRTVVIFSSDQGVHYGEHRWGAALGIPAAVQKQTLYEPVVRVPLLATGPGFERGETDVPVTQSDITATAVDLAGAAPSRELDGIDLRTVASRPDEYADRTILLQARTAFSPSPSHDSVVTGPSHTEFPLQKFSRLSTGEYEYYDLANDPGEFVNLANDPDHRSGRESLESELDRLLSNTSEETTTTGPR